MNEGFIPEKEISQWKIPVGNARFPSEDMRKLTVFHRYFEVGFRLLTNDFFFGVLHYYEVQAPHLSLNSFLHMPIFIHLCEAYMGIYPHFELFLNIFQLKSIPKGILGEPTFNSSRQCRSSTYHTSSRTPTRIETRSGSM